MSALQKYLEKSGMNLSYMKNAIRSARAAGIPILPKNLMSRIKDMVSSQPSPFAPMKEIPTYTHPIAQEFNVPYSVK